MGLLDQVLGQVLGRGASQSDPLGGATGQSGGLGGLLSGNRGPIAMALLALLASKHLKGGSGGNGGGLSDMFSGGASGMQSSGGSGGILGQLGGMLGGGNSSASSAGGLGGLGSLLGGGLTGGALAGGLGDLMNRFRQSGQGDIADSWVGHGPNAAISPDQLAQALDPEEVDELSRHTGLGRGELLSELSTVLPPVVDKLTPQGRLPTEDEHSQWV